jgi:predicted component of type VI protein secretion system
MKVRLKILSGAHAGMKFGIPAPLCLIGREQQCYVRPKSQAVSSRHCVLYVQDGKAFVGDLASRNGTFVNGRRIGRECELRDGDELRVGPFVFQVCLDDAPGGEKQGPVAGVGEAANLAGIGAQDVPPLPDADIARWLAENDARTRPRPTNARDTRPTPWNKTNHVVPQEADQPRPADFKQAAYKAQGEAAHAGAKDNRVKLPGSWRSASAASTQDAATDALRILLGAPKSWPNHHYRDGHPDPTPARPARSP